MLVFASGMRGLGLEGRQLRVSTMGWVSCYYLRWWNTQYLHLRSCFFHFLAPRHLSVSVVWICMLQYQSGFTMYCKCCYLSVTYQWFTQCTCLIKWKPIKDGYAFTSIIKSKTDILYLRFIYQFEHCFPLSFNNTVRAGLLHLILVQ